MRPPAHTVEPNAHSPVSPYPSEPGGVQLSPVPGSGASSISASQSSSAPLQLSGVPPTEPSQRISPSTHWKVPTEQPAPPPHRSPTGAPSASSVRPSQSSSLPLHDSVPGGTAGAVHTVPVPSALHTTTPVRWQLPSWPLSHWPPTPVKVSSMRPSQSSSSPLQDST